jgi:hypothetical protein
MQVDLSVTPEGISMTQHSPQRAPSQLVNTADFAARDERICCLSYGVMRKLAGLPQDLFAGYWRDVLGPLCARLPGVDYYVQHHFSQDHRANLWPLPDGIRRMDVVLDGAVEIGFADTDGKNRYVKASPVLFADAFHQRIPALAGIRACGTEITLPICRFAKAIR